MDYYVNRNAQPNSGDHEVHESDCHYRKIGQNMMLLGNFSNCHDAVSEAKKHFSQSNGCKICSSECHTG